MCAGWYGLLMRVQARVGDAEGWTRTADGPGNARKAGFPARGRTTYPAPFVSAMVSA